MDLVVATYLAYTCITVPLTVWVARTLHRHGGVFLIDVFEGNEVLAKSVNQLLVIGFYLLNLGYVALYLQTNGAIDDIRTLIEVLSRKVGGVAVVLGIVHFANVWAFNSFRRRAVRRAHGIPPVAPSHWTPVQP